MSRREFTAKVKLAAWERSGGRCECGGCDQQKVIGVPEYDHNIPAAIGGPATLDNCRVFRRECHALKTTRTDVPQIAKTKRIIAKRAGIKRTSRPMPGSKASGLKKHMDGSVSKR